MKPVYSLADLTDRPLLDEGAAKPARLAVIGHPVAHSASPQMHQAALDAAGIDARYIRLDVEPGQVADALRRMQQLGFIGCNVTVPHKLEVMAACDEIDPAASALGAVNTIRFEPDGRIRGCNTDAPGFRCAVEEAFGQPLARQRVLIVGAGGGAGQAVAMACLLAGVRELVLVNRTVAKLDPIISRLQQHGSACAIRALGLDDPALPQTARACDLIVNTSSLGLKPGDAPVLPRECLVAGQAVYDTIYQPPVTPLLALAVATGCRTANGLSMLLHQGALAFQWWFPGTDPLARMREALAAGRMA
jgi:shikimate dehydrogenase